MAILAEKWRKKDILLTYFKMSVCFIQNLYNFRLLNEDLYDFDFFPIGKLSRSRDSLSNFLYIALKDIPYTYFTDSSNEFEYVRQNVCRCGKNGRLSGIIFFNMRMPWNISSR